MTPTNVCNLALLEIGNRIQIGNLTDTTPAAQACATLYTPKMQMLMRSANWDFARAQAPLTQWKAAIIDGQLSSNPPPQPWLYSYLYPSDCLKMRFTQPTVLTSAISPPLTTNATNQQFLYPYVPTSIPYVEATDVDVNGNPIKVILSNIYQAQAVYTRDLTQTPDLWDSLFLSGATALLASYLVAALSLDKQLMQLQIGLAKNVIDQARAINANEAVPNVDHTPDWIRARMVGAGTAYGATFAQPAGTYIPYSQCGFPDGSFY